MILLDLFSGIGGFTKGFQDAGWQIDKHYYSDIDKYANAVYKYNFPEAIYVGDVRTISGIERPNIITFGSPCQDFSLAGKRKGLDGKRSSLIGSAITLIERYKPDIFIWENVKGVFSSNDGSDFWAVIQAFTDIGCYRLEWQLLNTAWFLPQNRERIYLIGHLGGRSGCEVFPIGEIDKPNNVIPRQQANTNTILQRYGNDAQGIKVGTLRTHNDGKGFREVQSNLSPTIPARAREDGSGQPIVIGAFRGRNKDNPSDRSQGIDLEQTLEIRNDTNTNTLTSVQKDNVVIINTNTKKGYEEANVGDTINLSVPTSKTRRGRVGKQQVQTLDTASNQAVVEQSHIRRLTPIECERLQGFPDNWTKYGNFDGEVKEISDTQRYKMCGNAVTCKVVEEIARRLKQ